jgi:hypothetical protein
MLSPWTACWSALAYTMILKPTFHILDIWITIQLDDGLFKLPKHVAEFLK